MDPARIHPDFALRDEIPSRCHPKSSPGNQNTPNPFSWNSCWFLAPAGIPPGIPGVMNPSRAELLKILQIPLGMGSLIPGRRQNLGFSLAEIPGVPKSFPCFHGRAAGTGILSHFYPPAPPGKMGISSRELLSRRKTLAPHPGALQKRGISAQNNPSKGNPSLNPTENYPRLLFPENYPRPRA